MSVETVLLACAVGLLIMAAIAVWVQTDDKRWRAAAAKAAQLRRLNELEQRLWIAESDRMTLREHARIGERASLAGDLSQVLSILDGPARDDERVKVARDRLDDIRRGL